MYKIKPLLLTAIITFSVFSTTSSNSFALQTYDNGFDLAHQYCNRCSILALLTTTAFIGWYLLQLQYSANEEEPVLAVDSCKKKFETDTITFFGEIKVTTDERIIQDPNEDFIKEYFAIDIVNDSTDYHSKKNGRVAIGNITKTSKFAVTYLNKTIPNSQFYAWPDEGNEMQEIKALVLTLPGSEKLFMVNMKLHRIDCTAKGIEIKKSEVEVELILELADADKIISSGFRLCESHHRNKESFLGTIKIVEDNNAINGVREIMEDPKRRCKNPEFQFNGNALPAKIGIKKGLSLISKQDESGLLNSGPFLSLPRGKYQVKINLLLNSSHSDNKLGHWDIHAFRLKEIIQTGDIIKSVHPELIIETDLTVTNELAEAAFEIRTYSNGKGVIELNSIIIEEI